MTNCINLLLLITELNVGGAEKIVEQLATRLPRERYRVKVGSLYDPHAVGTNIQAAGIPVIDLDMRGKGDLRAPYRLFRLLREEDIHVLHAHLFHANFLAATIGRLARVPLIVVTRHSVVVGGRHREWINRLTRPLCDAVVAVSRQVYEIESSRSAVDPAKAVEIPGGVDVDAFTETDPERIGHLKRTWNLLPGALLIGTVGRFVEPKGYPYLLTAVGRISKELPDTQALLVGDGPLRSSMERRTRELGLSDAVIFAGLRRGIAEVLALLDVFVLPSLWEGLPIALLEAMAAGLPVVATRVGGVPEAVVDGETGLLVPPRDPEALANATSKLLRDPELRHRMGEAGRERVRRHFSVDRMVSRTDALYHQLLEEKGLL